MTAKKVKLKEKFIFAIMLILSIGVMFFCPTMLANADETTFFVSAQVSDEDSGFNMIMTANSRKLNVPLKEDIRTQTNSLENPATFYCFNWSDLSSLQFHVSSNSAFQCTSHKLLLTYVPAENLSHSFGEGSTIALYEGNAFIPFDFYYYIDSNLTDKNNPNSKNGHDFGLYKFEFVYSYIQNENEISRTIGAINVAVLPDDIDEIEIPIDTTLQYTVSSSDKLLNVFNLSLSSQAYDLLRYVNPAYLQWEVFGEDADKVHYCLDRKMQEKMEYGNFQLVWNSYLPPSKTTGTNFTFDSNNIEGTWTAILTIKNSQDKVIFTQSVSNLSTYKVARKSYLWLILLVSFLLLTLIGIIILIVVIKHKKHEKVW